MTNNQNNIIQDILKRFDEKFVKHQDIFEASPENPIIIGSKPPVDDVKQFLLTAIKEVLEVVKEEIDYGDENGNGAKAISSEGKRQELLNEIDKELNKEV